MKSKPTLLIRGKYLINSKIRQNFAGSLMPFYREKTLKFKNKNEMSLNIKIAVSATFLTNLCLKAF